MSVSIPDFWKLLVDSRLLTAEQCHLLGGEFAAAKGAAEQANAKALSQFLIARNALTHYQAAVLLAGRSGPFFYGDYKVYDRVDQGRLAGCFRAIHVPTSHLVMLQFFTGPVTQDPQQWAVMAQQAQMHCAVAHPNLQRWHEPVDLTSFKFLVGEDLQGESLEQRLAACGVLPPHEACRVIRAAALGLAQLHQAGLVHGDIRPRNLWFEPHGHVKLLRDPASTPTPIHLTPADQAAELLARSEYMAPELAQQGKTHDALTDLYALGATCYQLLSGRPPFAGGDVMQKLGRHAAERIAPLEPLGVPPQIGQVVSYMMAKNPAVRFQQASMVADQLAPFIDPAYLYLQPAPPALSQAGYETWVAQKQAALSGAAYATHAAQQPPPDVPLVDVSRRRAPITIGPPGAAAVAAAPQAFATQFSPPQSLATGPAAPPLGGLAVAVSPSIGPPGAAAVETKTSVAPVKLKHSSPTSELHKEELAELEGGFSNRKTRNLALGLGIVAVLAIAGVIAINTLGGGKPKKTTDDVSSTETDTTDGGETALHTPDVAAKPTKHPGVTPPNDITHHTAVASDSPGTVKTPVKPEAPGPSGVKKPNGGTKTPGANTNPGGTATTTTNDGPATEAAAVSQEIVPDDGNLLWASPTSGPPISLAYLPPGSQLFLVARPAEMLASAEGARVFTALGPQFQAARAEWENATGFKLTDVEQMTLGLYENGGQTPRPALVVRLKSPLPKEELLEKWGNPEPAAAGKEPIYTHRSWSFYIPAAENGKLFVMGSPTELEKVIEFKGAAPALRREIDKVRAASDAQRHVTLFFAPNYLFNDEGQKLFAGDREKLLAPLSWFLGDDLKAGMVSLHFGGETYAEVRLVADAGRQKFELAKEFKDRLQQVPAAIEGYIDELNAPTYWKGLARRFPLAIGFLHQHTRVGLEGDQAVINVVLPASAAHNLVAASELAISSAPGAPATAVSTAPPKPAPPMTIDDLLTRKTSLNFAQDSLEFSMQNVVAQVKADFPSLPFEFKVVLMGNDMKLDGITKNQSIRDFNEKDKTVAEILTAMVRKANPITTVKDPSELDQKLIWVIGPDPDSAEKPCILVTTRAAAEKNNYKLPPPFVPKAG